MKLTVVEGFRLTEIAAWAQQPARTVERCFHRLTRETGWVQPTTRSRCSRPSTGASASTPLVCTTRSSSPEGFVQGRTDRLPARRIGMRTLAGARDTPFGRVAVRPADSHRNGTAPQPATRSTRSTRVRNAPRCRSGHDLMLGAPTCPSPSWNSRVQPFECLAEPYGASACASVVALCRIMSR